MSARSRHATIDQDGTTENAMPIIVVNGASLRCDQGTTPASLVVLPANQTDGASMSAATVMDHKPSANIMPFGMCRSLSNPQVAAATSAAYGVLTPQPCIPVTMTPWSAEEPSVTIRSLPVLVDGATCKCAWGGTVSIESAGATTIDAG